MRQRRGLEMGKGVAVEALVTIVKASFHNTLSRIRVSSTMSSRPQTAEDKGTNVKVVVRCRPFSLNEKVREKVSRAMTLQHDVC
jgi:hypothetical protein